MGTRELFRLQYDIWLQLLVKLVKPFNLLLNNITPTFVSSCAQCCSCFVQPLVQAAAVLKHLTVTSCYQFKTLTWAILSHFRIPTCTCCSCSWSSIFSCFSISNCNLSSAKPTKKTTASHSQVFTNLMTNNKTRAIKNSIYTILWFYAIFNQFNTTRH